MFLVFFFFLTESYFMKHCECLILPSCYVLVVSRQGKQKDTAVRKDCVWRDIYTVDAQVTRKFLISRYCAGRDSTHSRFDLSCFYERSSPKDMQVLCIWYMEIKLNNINVPRWTAIPIFKNNALSLFYVHSKAL